MKLISFLTFAFLAACGSLNPREAPSVNPTDQSIEVGAKETYVLDPSKSNSLLLSGDLIVEVVEKSAEVTKFKVDGNIKTSLGPKKLNILQPVPSNIFTTKFLEELRRVGSYTGKDFKLTYKGIEGTCERIYMYDMKGYEYIKVNGLLCLGTKNVPRLDTTIVLFGQQLKSVFLLKY